MTTPNLDNIRIWHDALVSDRYPQITGLLRSDDSEDQPHTTGYCCLGVAVECAIAGGVPLEWDGEAYRWRDGVEGLEPDETSTIWETELPPVVQDWLGVYDDNPLLGNDENADAAISLNDTYRWTFAQIAEAIEHTWPTAFTKESA